MTKSIRIKAALVVLLVAAAAIGQQTSTGTSPADRWVMVGVLAFGILNVLFQAAGTRAVQSIAFGATFCALLWPGAVLVIVVLLAWLVWPPAFMVAWALARKPQAEAGNEDLNEADSGGRARLTAAAVIGAVATASLLYRALVTHNLQQTAALFIGIPALIAIVVVFAVSPKSAVGVACKAVTVALLVSMLFLGEGMVCVVMSAPLFYAIAVVIASTMERIHRGDQDSASTLFSSLILLAIVPMSVEGVAGVPVLNREESVAEARVVRASSAAVERALFEPPRFNRARPRYLRAGFPSPVSARVERRSGEQLWVIQIRGGEMRLDGLEPRTGDLILALEDARPGLVRWRAVSDGSHTTHFLDWRESIVQWDAIDAETTKVTWTLEYRRGLDPSWYFGPWERYAVRLAAGYLIDSVATP